MGVCDGCVCWGFVKWVSNIGIGIAIVLHTLHLYNIHIMPLTHTSNTPPSHTHSIHTHPTHTHTSHTQDTLPPHTQRYGTSTVSIIFAPVICAWLLLNAGIGVHNIMTYHVPIIHALHPGAWISLARATPVDTWHKLSGVLLCVTGMCASGVLLCVTGIYTLYTHYTHTMLTLDTHYSLPIHSL